MPDRSSETPQASGDPSHPRLAAWHRIPAAMPTSQDLSDSTSALTICHQLRQHRRHLGGSFRKRLFFVRYPFVPELRLEVTSGLPAIRFVAGSAERALSCSSAISLTPTRSISLKRCST